MLYLVAAYTGLRASVLAALAPESFALDADPATVTVEAAYRKHRRQDVIPLHPDLANTLRPWLAGRPTDERLWPGKWAEHCRGGEMLKRDLAAAGVPYEVGGKFADFHCLRHTFITELVKAGVQPKDAKELARHSTITLTMDRYAHVTLRDTAAAVSSLPSPPATTAPEALRATGTDGASSPREGENAAGAYTLLTHAIDSPCDALIGVDRSARDNGARTPAPTAGRKSLPDKGFEAAWEPARATEGQGESGGGGIRTRERLAALSVFKTDAIGHSATPPICRFSIILKDLCSV